MLALLGMAGGRLTDGRAVTIARRNRHADFLKSTTGILNFWNDVGQEDIAEQADLTKDLRWLLGFG